MLHFAAPDINTQDEEEDASRRSHGSAEGDEKQKDYWKPCTFFKQSTLYNANTVNLSL